MSCSGNIEIIYVEDETSTDDIQVKSVINLEDLMLTPLKEEIETFSLYEDAFYFTKNEPLPFEESNEVINNEVIIYTTEESSQISKRKCHFCNKQFNRQGEFRRHMRIHNGESFICKICDKKFTRQSNLWKHVHLHTGIKAFQCQTCFKKFSQKANLKKHELIHEGKKPYSCNSCGKSFSQLVNLDKHIRIHTGEKPFNCEICDKRFTQQSNLNRHLISHKNTESYFDVSRWL